MAKVGHALTRSFSGARLQPQSSGGKYGTPSPASAAVRFKRDIDFIFLMIKGSPFTDVPDATFVGQPDADDLQVVLPREVLFHGADGPRRVGAFVERRDGRTRFALRNSEEGRARKGLVHEADPVQVRSIGLGGITAISIAINHYSPPAGLRNRLPISRGPLDTGLRLTKTPVQL